MRNKLREVEVHKVLCPVSLKKPKVLKSIPSDHPNHLPKIFVPRSRVVVAKTKTDRKSERGGHTHMKLLFLLS